MWLARPLGPQKPEGRNKEKASLGFKDLSVPTSCQRAGVTPVYEQRNGADPWRLSCRPMTGADT